MTLKKTTLLGLVAFLFSCSQTQTADKKSSSKDTITQAKTSADTAAEHLDQVEFKLDTNAWTDFTGSLGKTPIQMSLFLLDNGELKGNYCLNEKDRKIQLTGRITRGRITLNDFLNGKPNGHLEGKIFTDNLDRFEGTRTDISNTNAVAFKLSLRSICASNFDKRYADFYGADEDVEEFMTHVKTSILNGDKEWIGNHISYPLSTTLFKNKSITVKNKNQLIDNFDQIFHQEFKDNINSFCVCNMFNNYRGAMLGNGEVWINNTPNSTENKFDFTITAINN